MRYTDFVRLVFGATVMLLLFACSDAAEEATIDKTIPNNVLAQSGDGEVILSWDPVEGAEQYNACWAYVTIKDCNNGNPRVIFKEDVGDLDPESNLIVWKHTRITNSTTYRYVILAYAKSWGNSPVSVNVVGVPQGKSPLAPPVGVSISANGVIPTISWRAVVGATSYNLYMAYMDDKTNIISVNKNNYNSSPGGLSGGMRHHLSSNQLSFTHSSLLEDKLYAFVVTAERDIGGGDILETVESDEIYFIPRAIVSADDMYLPNDFKVTPTYLQVDTEQVDEKLNVSFTDPCKDQTSNIFKVFWTTGPLEPPICTQVPDGAKGTFLDCDADPTSGDPLPIPSLIEGTYYYFTMQTSYGAECSGPKTSNVQTSGFSSVIAAKTPGKALPTTPIITAIAGVNAVTVNIENADSTIYKYNLYMAANGHCDANNPKLSIDNYLDDTVWGMVHSNIPAEFIHVALPSTIPFCFIVSSIDKVTGIESIASNEVIMEAN